MKTTMLNILGASAVVMCLAMTACKDDEQAPSKRPLLIDKAWVTVKMELNGVDFTDEQEPCEMDDAITFFSDGSFLDDINNTPCDEFDEDAEGSWEFKANETVLSLRPVGESATDLKVLSLTANQLKLSQSVPQLGGEVVFVMEPK